MSQNKTSESPSGELVKTRNSRAMGWVKLAGGAILLIVGLVLLLKLAGFLFKWAILLLLIYGAYRLVLHLFSGSPSDAQESVFELEDTREDSALGLLENERDLDALKIKMRQKAPSDE